MHFNEPKETVWSQIESDLVPRKEKIMELCEKQ